MLNKRRVLIIDSSDSARTILFKELTAAMPDLDIIACATGKEAISAINRYEFQIITTGITLDDMDGYKAIEHIRQSAKNKDTAVFVISGDTDTRIMHADSDDSNAVTAYIDKAEGHKTLVNFILNFLGKDTSSPTRVVYVDQSPTSTAITSSVLSKNGVEFNHFKEADDAIAFLQEDLDKNNKCTIDIVITDLTLSSQKSGVDLIHHIRNEMQLDYLTLPVLLMTIEPGEDERTDFTGIFGAGSNDFITKPLDEEDLLNRIRTLVNIKRQSAALK